MRNVQLIAKERYLQLQYKSLCTNKDKYINLTVLSACGYKKENGKKAIIKRNDSRVVMHEGAFLNKNNITS